MSFVFASKDGSGDITDSNGNVVSFATVEQAEDWAAKNGVSPDLFTIDDVPDAAQKEPKAQDVSSAEKWTGAAFPRTMEAAKRGDQFPVVSGILDAASLPGRTLAAMFGTTAAASDVGYRGLGEEMSSRMAQTRSKSDFLPTMIAEDVLRDPVAPLSIGTGLVLGRLASVAAPTTKYGMMGREALKAGAEGAISGASVGNEQGTGFAPLGAVVGAVPGVATGYRSSINAAANEARRTTLTRPEIVKALYADAKPGTPTMRQASPSLQDLPTFERIAFVGDEYAPPALGNVGPDTQEPWDVFLSNLEDRVSNIGAKQSAAMSGPEFATQVPAPRVLRDVANAPRKKYEAGDIMLSDLREGEKNIRVPFGDVADRILGDRSNPISAEVADDLYNITKAWTSEDGGNTVSIANLIDLKRKLNAKRKDLGGYRTPNESALSQSYKDAYDAVNDIIKESLPQTENTQAYRNAEVAFAQSIPWRDAMDLRIQRTLKSNKPLDQSVMGRVAMLMEGPGGFRSRVNKAMLVDLPPKVNISNAMELYRSSPQLVQQAENALRMGGSGGSAQLATRYMPRLAQLIQEDTQK